MCGLAAGGGQHPGGVEGGDDLASGTRLDSGRPSGVAGLDVDEPHPRRDGIPASAPPCQGQVNTSRTNAGGFVPLLEGPQQIMMIGRQGEMTSS